MRGKASDPAGSAMLSGITPAYAGKREHWGYLHQAVWDHPRLCGEKFQKA